MIILYIPKQKSRIEKISPKNVPKKNSNCYVFLHIIIQERNVFSTIPDMT